MTSFMVIGKLATWLALNKWLLLPYIKAPLIQLALWDWSRKFAPLFLNQSDSKLPLIATSSLAFSRALQSLFVFKSSSHWLLLISWYIPSYDWLLRLLWFGFYETQSKSVSFWILSTLMVDIGDLFLLAKNIQANRKNFNHNEFSLHPPLILSSVF